MKEYLEKCEMCPRRCMINRYEKKGFCKAGSLIKVAHISLHQFEEPCISHKNGSGTVFFSGCNLACVYCQNYKISTNEYGKELTIDELADVFLKLQNMNAENINLVSPTIYALLIREALLIAKSKGLNIPVVYNTNGYENIDVLKKMEDVIDIYLPDFKYFNNFLARKYSNCDNYKEIATNTILECLRQKNENIYDENGKLLKGVVIRHLVLPSHILNTKNSLKYLKDTFGNNIILSIMMQYFPTYKAEKYEKINRKVNKIEYKKVENIIEELDLKNGYIQSLEQCEEKYVPNFDITTLN